jgi:hypothetical protein
MKLSRPQWMSRLVLLPVVAQLLTLSGCTPSVIDGGFDSPMAASRLYAIERAVRDGDTSKIRNIIEQLESDDPAIRMTAIGALERLTHRTYGYHHEDPLLVRREAIRRWRVAYESGELDDVIELRSNSASFHPERSAGCVLEGDPHG